MSDVEMNLSFDIEPMMDAVAKLCEVEFLTEQSKPQSVDQVLQATHYILKQIARSFMEASTSTKHLALFARGLGFNKLLDPDKELDKLFDRVDVSDDVKDLLKILIKKIEERDSLSGDSK